ncbi:MAG: hypothetical protein HRT42_00140 [Campylobacteraceae bacterium]|nr:hypothetical protein [Campylobacteraceae bacterium]
MIISLNTNYFPVSLNNKRTSNLMQSKQTQNNNKSLKEETTIHGVVT